MRPRDQGEQLPRDRVARRRVRQAPAQEFQRPVPVLLLDGDGAEVEEDERLLGPVLQLLQEDAAIAAELPGRRATLTYPVCRTTRSVHRTGIPARRSAGMICSWTR